MRTWGRVFPEEGQPFWVEVSTDQNGQNDAVWITTLAQCLLLGLGESPFYANLGIPAQQSVQTGVPPDYYVAALQQFFAPFFASLTISRNPGLPPSYNLGIVTHSGVSLNPQVSVPI